MSETISAEKKTKVYGKWDKWDIESAARTLEEAEEIKADKEKMKYVEKCLKKKIESTKKAYKSISDMREEYKTMED